MVSIEYARKVSLTQRLSGVPLTLPPESEEVAGFFGAMLETDHAKDATFCDNFFGDFKKVLDQYPPVSRAFCLDAPR